MRESITNFPIGSGAYVWYICRPVCPRPLLITRAYTHTHLQQHGGKHQHPSLRWARDEHKEYCHKERGRGGASRQFRGGASCFFVFCRCIEKRSCLLCRTVEHVFGHVNEQHRNRIMITNCAQQFGWLVTCRVAYE